MARGSRGSRRGPGKVIDNVFWTAAFPNSLALTAGSDSLAVITTLLRPQTILRVRGNTVVWIDGVPDAGDAVTVTQGLIVVSEGVSVSNLPLTDPLAPWLWWDSCTVGFEEGNTGDAGGYSGLTSYRAIVDSKAMRRMRPEQDLRWVVEATTLGTAQAVNVSTALRILSGD